MKTSDELKELKKKWYDTAKVDGSFQVLRVIGRYLGTPVRSNYGPKYEFKDGDYTLYIDDYGNYMTVKMIDRLVCSTHNERLYIPDICDRFVNKHAKAAWAAKALYETKIEEKEKAKLEKELLGN